MALGRIGKFQNTELLWPQFSFRTGLSTVRFGRRNAPILQKSPGQTRSGVLLCHANNLGPPPGEGERSGGEWLKALDLLAAFFSSGNTGRRKGQRPSEKTPVPPFFSSENIARTIGLCPPDANSAACRPPVRQRLKPYTHLQDGAKLVQ